MNKKEKVRSKFVWGEHFFIWQISSFNLGLVHYDGEEVAAVTEEGILDCGVN